MIISKHEAIYAIITGLISETTLYFDPQEDVYTGGFPENYVLNKNNLIHEGEAIVYYPTDEDIKIFEMEARKIFRKLLEIKRMAEHKYNVINTQILPPPSNR